MAAVLAALPLHLASGQAAKGVKGGATVVKTRSTESDSVTFASALAKEYGIYIRAERERYTWDFDRGHFRRKRAAAARGVVVRPDGPAEWGVSGATGVALREGRARLMRALSGTAREQVPALSAKAQVAYDCWAYRAASRYSYEAVDECRWRFFDAVATLEDAVMPIRARAVFNRTLAREYIAYADFEAKDQKDYIDSRHFGAKGLVAANAQEVTATEPEVLGRWNLLSTQDVPTFVQWRERLMAALRVHRTSSRARIAALAQARFDCWVERTSERNDTAHIQKCRTEFLDYMRQLAGADASASQSFTVYFRFNSSRVTGRQRQVVRDAAKYALSKNARSIQVVGHTDRAGAQRYNVRLSFQRAERVARMLRRLGVRADRIRTLHLGESQPAVPTKDGVRNRQNRRAVIVIR